jgi:hypothetical protein
MLLSPGSVNQRLQSRPRAMPDGELLTPSGVTNSVMTPLDVMRPILALEYSVNQRFASGPTAMPPGPAVRSVSGNSVTVPDGVTRAI